jgi:hypothetical protein
VDGLRRKIETTADDATSVQGLQPIVFDPCVPLPILEAGLHRRQALIQRGLKLLGKDSELATNENTTFESDSEGDRARAVEVSPVKTKTHSTG